MTYDSKIIYSSADFRELTPEELQILFEEVRKASLDVRGFKQIKKVVKDISDIRRLLNGFDSTYNKEHR